jgi:hypothetical protein
MIARRSSLFVIGLLCVALIAACGGSSSTTSGSTATSAPATASTTAASKPATSTTAAPKKPATSKTATPGISEPITSAAVVKRYVAICKQIVQREPSLAASVKSKVEGICAKAASGDVAGARAAAKEVCVQVINASPLPAVDKQEEIAACKAS